MIILKDVLLLSVLNFITPCVSVTCRASWDEIVTATDTPQDLTSPGYPLRYPSNAVCWWKLEANDSQKVVVMETIDFMLHVGSRCDRSHDSLIVGEPSVPSGVRVNVTMCGDDRRMIISHGSSLGVFFWSDKQYEERGFKIRFYQATAKAPCNFDLIASDAKPEKYFNSPGYPGEYFNNLECNYTIRTETPSHRVEIEVMESDIEDATHCQYDRITVVDQNNGTDQILGTICGTETSTYQSSGNSLQVQFVSNSRKINKGFKIRYKSVDMSKCEFHMHATRMDSFLVSPGYPSHYYSNLTCKWGIYASMNRSVELSVIKSNIAGYGSNCTGDKMEISDTDVTNLDKVFCGNMTPSFQISRSSFISLYTDGDTENQGFLMRYRLQKENITLVPCGGKLDVNSTSQTLQSPLYPDTPLENHTCVWNLAAADTVTNIMVSLEDLDIEMSSKCVFDSLSIYNGSNELDSAVLETWCGQRGGDVIYSTGQHLTIVYMVDDSNNGRGFSLTFATVKASDLAKETSHRTAKDSVSYLTPPGFTNYFPRNRVFSYIFTAAQNNKIRLDVRRSSLPVRSNGTCTGGTKVIAYDGPTNTAPRLPSLYSQYFTWCGQDRPLYVSSNNSMLLEYYTGSQGDKDVGFELKYQQGSYNNWWYHECGGWLTASSTPMYLTSPNFPIYTSNMFCRWVIHTSIKGTMIRLTALNISLDEDNTFEHCSHDSITIYDGTENPDNRRDVWCESIAKIFQTTGSVLTIVFKTGQSTAEGKNGFKLEYFETTETPPCIQTFAVRSEPRIFKTSGYYQQPLPLNTTCMWTFSPLYPLRADYIKLNVTSLDGAETNNQTCIKMYDGIAESSSLIDRLCGGEHETYIGLNTSILVKMVTGSSESKGFQIAYTAVYGALCYTRYLTASLNDSFLTSPFYPMAMYPNNLDCIWTLSTGDYYHMYIVMIEVLETDIEYSEGCVKDYVEAYDAFGTSSPIGRWCGTQTPKYQSTGNSLTIKFQTDSSVSKSGFKLKYSKKYYDRFLPATSNPNSQKQTSHPTQFGKGSNIGTDFGTDTEANVGAIIGGTLGGVFIAVILIIIIGVFVFLKSNPNSDERRGHTNHQSAALNMQAYSNNAYSGAGDSYIAPPSTYHTETTEDKSPPPEYSTLATGDTTLHHYEGIQSRTQVNGGTQSDHPSIDNKDQNYSAMQSTNM